MSRYFVVSLTSGILFATLDGLVNANPIARDLFSVYEPIARSSVNMTVGLAVDLIFGFILAGTFLILYKSLPGKAGVLKGLSFAVLVWFFRVAMGAASSWVMFELPAITLFYVLLTGLVEMTVLGLFYGWFLAPES